MTNKLDFLIKILCEERGESAPALNDCEKHQLFRALVNVRMPKAASTEFIKIQDEYLQEELRLKGVTDIDNLSPIADGIYLWKGDITTLRCDGIVNAANSQMLGCFCPNHGCIDNAIHTFAGVQLRRECAEIMKAQGKPEATGQAKITSAYNLPCKYVLHTVGPIVYGELSEKHERELADCYRSCLALADKNGLKSIAFCCISTGEFHFPNERAAQVAVHTVLE
ncbi:MAG: protein-ADP-ribose hydrolase, partial [Clostridia bacterium]|nr:protein-ADP-ribose hydrolase [Clostridia bacterium]